MMQLHTNANDDQYQRSSISCALRGVNDERMDHHLITQCPTVTPPFDELYSGQRRTQLWQHQSRRHTCLRCTYCMTLSYAQPYVHYTLAVQKVREDCLSIIDSLAYTVYQSILIVTCIMSSRGMSGSLLSCLTQPLTKRLN